MAASRDVDLERGLRNGGVAVHDPGKFTMSIMLAPGRGTMGIGVRATPTDPADSLTDILRDAKVTVILRDSNGRHVSSRTGPLSDFGFG